MRTLRWLAGFWALAALGSACGASKGDASSHDGGASPETGAGEASGDGASPQDATSDASLDAVPDGPGLADGSGALPDGGLFVQFVASDETVHFDPTQEGKSTGTVAFGVASAGASDNAVATLTRTGGQAPLGTAGAEEIVSRRAFSFGTFRFRLALATCASTEEVVNGPFAYFNDGSKAPDGLVINREVDIEILCGEPWLINLTIWTEYTDDTHFKNQSRVVDTKAGKVYVYANDQSGNETATENHPELLIPGWPQAGTFYEMGWTWSPTSLRYFLVVGGAEVTLWDATDATRIPQAPMPAALQLVGPRRPLVHRRQGHAPGEGRDADARLVPLRPAVRAALSPVRSRGPWSGCPVGRNGAEGGPNAAARSSSWMTHRPESGHAILPVHDPSAATGPSSARIGPRDPSRA